MVDCQHNVCRLAFRRNREWGDSNKPQCRDSAPLGINLISCLLACGCV